MAVVVKKQMLQGGTREGGSEAGERISGRGQRTREREKMRKSQTQTLPEMFWWGERG